MACPKVVCRHLKQNAEELKTQDFQTEIRRLLLGRNLSGNPRLTAQEALIQPVSQSKSEATCGVTAQCLCKNASLRTVWISGQISCWIFQSKNQNWTYSNTFYPPFPILISVFQPLNHNPFTFPASLHIQNVHPHEGGEVTGAVKYEKKMEGWGPLAYERNDEGIYDSYLQLFQRLSVKDKIPLWHEAPKP